MSEILKRWNDRVFQRQKARVTNEEFRLQCIEELKQMASKCRVRGDFWLADRIEMFCAEYFGEEP